MAQARNHRHTDQQIATELEQTLYQQGQMGLEALVYAAKQYQVVISKDQLAHQLGGVAQVSAQDLCRCAKWLGLKTKQSLLSFDRIEQLSLPVLIQMNQNWAVLEKVTEDQILVYHPENQSTQCYQRQSSANIDSCLIILLAEQGALEKETAFGFRWFIPSIIKHIQQFRMILGVSLFLQIIALVMPMLFENIIDKVLVSRSVNSLHVLGLALTGLTVFEPLFSMLRAWLFSHLASKVNAELTTRIYRHLMGLPLQYFQQRQTGEMIARIREMDQVRQFLTGSALTLIIDFIFVGLFISVMFFYSSQLTWLVLSSLCIYFVFWLAFGPALRERVNQAYECNAANTAFISETITGIETVKTSAIEQDFIKSWQKRLAKYIHASFQAKILGICAGQGIDLIQKMTAAILLWWGVQLVLEAKLSPGELVAFNMLAGYVTQPILRLAQVWQEFQHTLIALRRLGDILNEARESSSQGMVSVPKIKGSVAFQQVRFRYHKDSPEILQNVHFMIKPGEFIGITGPSGSGKSTLTRLIQRLYVPQHGQVFIDGIDLAIADPVAIRQSMSIVLQESLLFAGSVADNIRLCLPKATDQAMQQAAKLAGADTFIQQLPAGYETQVGEKGRLLSGGQRQRIALARALMTNPSLLILDEATSALDYESEAAILSNMQSIATQRTVISIAHRLNTIKDADRILVMDQGQILESGNHQALLKNNGLYAKLWQLQTSAQEKI